MKPILRVFLAILLAMNFHLLFAQTPYLDKSGKAPKLMVDGKPFIILGGELHNSTGSDKEAMAKVWKEMKALNLNTVLAYAYWELLEPQEGKFNFDLVDEAIMGAQKENLKIVLVWFGAWKSTSSTYVPEWVKTNPSRFQRYTLEGGKTLEMLSPFSDENRIADAKAYTALMQHLKDFDKNHTVIMTQIENEPGCFENYRDLSPAAQKVWQNPMPNDMVNYLKTNKGKLFPALEKAWADNGNKTKGTWEEILGKSTDQGEYKFYTEELFMAYNYSKYINFLAERGKKIHNLPAFCNGWLYNKRGTYPHGTINPHVLDAYRAAGSSMDFYSPNVYTIEYDELFDAYTFGGNTLFIPESSLMPAGALYAIGKYNALGFAPFGIDGERMKSKENINNLNLLKSTYKSISEMTGMISQNFGSEKLKGVYLNPNKEKQEVKMGDFKLVASSSRKPGFSIDFGKSLENAGKARMSFGPPPSETKDEKPKPVPASPFGQLPEEIGSAIIVQNADNEFFIVGYGIKMDFALNEGISFNHLGFLSIDEGYFENDQFVATKRWNGDEQKVSLPGDKITTLKVRLYRN
ncbi:MAG: DUF5597 domain-containing protein [Bacteroidota bacterium]